ncbi:MAG: hypothetical protein K0R73_1257 [Candidatus Midichloriaceae bacterium]|jgi:hypothetical protein|nr:hypothetical protein [Candidatus Midichloriaceae bacterium]
MRDDKYLDSWYGEEHILKVWNKYIQNGIDGEKLRYDVLGVGCIYADSLFYQDIEKKMRLEYPAGIIICKDTGKLWANKKYQSVSICGPVDYVSKASLLGGYDAITYYIKIALQQIRDWNFAKKNEDKIKSHIIVFPYHITAVHWCLGTLELKFSKSKMVYASISITNPLPSHGGSSISEKVLEELSKLIKDIFEFPPEFVSIVKDLESKTQQCDNTSCGAISAENGKDAIEGIVDRKNKTYNAESIKQIREQHAEFGDEQEALKFKETLTQDVGNSKDELLKTTSVEIIEITDALEQALSGVEEIKKKLKDASLDNIKKAQIIRDWAQDNKDAFRKTKVLETNLLDYLFTEADEGLKFKDNTVDILGLIFTQKQKPQFGLKQLCKRNNFFLIEEDTLKEHINKAKVIYLIINTLQKMLTFGTVEEINQAINEINVKVYLPSIENISSNDEIQGKIKQLLKLALIEWLDIPYVCGMEYIADTGRVSGNGFPYYSSLGITNLLKNIDHEDWEKIKKIIPVLNNSFSTIYKAIDHYASKEECLKAGKITNLKDERARIEEEKWKNYRKALAPSYSREEIELLLSAKVEAEKKVKEIRKLLHHKYYLENQEGFSLDHFISYSKKILEESLNKKDAIKIILSFICQERSIRSSQYYLEVELREFGKKFSEKDYSQEIKRYLKTAINKFLKDDLKIPFESESALKQKYFQLKRENDPAKRKQREAEISEIKKQLCYIFYLNNEKEFSLESLVNHVSDLIKLKVDMEYALKVILEFKALHVMSVSTATDQLKSALKSAEILLPDNIDSIIDYIADEILDSSPDAKISLAEDLEDAEALMQEFSEIKEKIQDLDAMIKIAKSSLSVEELKKKIEEQAIKQAEFEEKQNGLKGVRFGREINDLKNMVGTIKMIGQELKKDFESAKTEEEKQKLISQAKEEKQKVFGQISVNKKPVFESIEKLEAHIKEVDQVHKELERINNQLDIIDKQKHERQEVELKLKETVEELAKGSDHITYDDKLAYAKKLVMGQLQKAKEDLPKFTLEAWILREYQIDFEIKNIENILKFYLYQLNYAQTNIQKVGAICDFVDWYIDRCSKEMQSAVESIL